MSASLSRIRIFAADDHTIARQWIASLVGVYPDSVLAGKTPKGCRSTQRVRTHQESKASCRTVLLRFMWPRRTIAGTVGCYFMYLSLLARPAYALDPNKRITQYVHSAWRVRDGFTLSTGFYGIAQTSDGFLWFISGDMATFDGVRFTSWDGPPNGGSITKGASFGENVNAFGDHAGGLWVFGLRGDRSPEGSRGCDFSVRVGGA